MNKLSTILGLCAIMSTAAQAQTTLTIDAAQRGAVISPSLYGIFFEEINHAGDGGLYAELVQNRSFEDDTEQPAHWQTVGSAQAAVCTDDNLNSRQAHNLHLTVNADGDGIRNEGFWGMNIVEGVTYKLSLWIKADEAWYGSMKATLTNRDGQALGDAVIDQALKGGEWTQLRTEITATGTDHEGQLQLTFSQPGTIHLDVVSLFPPTYKNRENGCRIDLAQMLEALHPRFMRFPGGCYVEGQTSPTNNRHNRFEWKNTIGPIEQRPGHLSVNWGYNISDGFGFHEMLQLAEDLGAEPLFVVNVGLGHGWEVPLDQLQPYIDEALDAIEYCNGDVSTRWGAIRAANGHPEPFGLRLLEIGNENANFSFDDNRDQSHQYHERYRMFYDAIKDRFPEMQLIGNVESWGTDNPSWRSDLPVDILDEHYYRSPSWFANNYEKYDSYDRNGPKIYIGEYAVTQGFGDNGHLTAALGEAIYMLGLERNADVVIMGSYAPIFVNEHNPAWRPDMIRFNASRSFGTPSYHVQRIMANNVGTQNLAFQLTGDTQPASIGHQLGLSTWGTSVFYQNIRVTDARGRQIYAHKSAADSTHWSVKRAERPGRNRHQQAEWSFANNALFQSDSFVQGGNIICDAQLGNKYAIELQACKTGGGEGFLIVFGYADDQNYLWWNLGGWGNSQHAVEQTVNGSRNTIAAARGQLEEGRLYDVRIEVDGVNIRCLLDGQLIHEFTLAEQRSLYAATSIDEPNGTLLVKLVNPTASFLPTDIQLSNIQVEGGSAVVLTSASGMDENSMRQPRHVVPIEKELEDVQPCGFNYIVPPFSLNILRLGIQK
ncbi:MAG: carbohydrate binding domain-containing protein [Bacteroidaceae bacterium]|nr:carbohydrate binding domain-containing protein [Bacteroidaceae bacterium]